MSYNPIFEEEYNRDRDRDLNELRNYISSRAGRDNLSNLSINFKHFVKAHPIFVILALLVFIFGRV